MAKGPNYRVPFKRRRKGKTNYYLRRKLLTSGKHRFVIRPSNKNVTCQVADAHLSGDVVISVAHSKELVKQFNWNFNTGNLPAAYLTGYLLGKKALKAGVGDGIADIGLRVHIKRTYAALKGMVDAGVDIPHSEDSGIFPSEDRLMGKHIEEYSKLVKDNNKNAEDDEKSSQFNQQFKDGVDVGKMSSVVADIKKKIDKQYS